MTLSSPSPDLVPPGVAAEHILSLIRDRSRNLSVPADTREIARAMVKDHGAPGMDEAKLFPDWKSDVLSDDEEGAYEAASAAPGKAYLEYVRTRLDDPFFVSFRAVRSLARKIGDDEANLFVHLRWRQEVAWAKRMRASRDARTAVIAHTFLMTAAKEPSKSFLDLAEAWVGAMADPAFSMSPTHAMTVSAIRASETEAAHVPAFQRLFALRHGSIIDKMTDARLVAASSHARSVEEAELRTAAARRSAAVARNSPLSRVIGVIEAARSTGRSSDELVSEERSFLRELEMGRVPGVHGGYPYADFIRWLRAPPSGVATESTKPGDVAYRNLTRLLNNPLSWLQSLPADYIDMQATTVSHYREWVDPFMAGSKPPPLDLVVDYGFFLVAKTFHS